MGIALRGRPSPAVTAPARPSVCVRCPRHESHLRGTRTHTKTKGFRSPMLWFSFVREARKGVFVDRAGGFRVPLPCRRPTGRDAGMPHGEGRRPSSRCGIPVSQSAQRAGRQGNGFSWSRVALNMPIRTLRIQLPLHKHLVAPRQIVRLPHRHRYLH